MIIKCLTCQDKGICPKKIVACAYRRTNIPKLTEEHVENRLKFFRTRPTGPKKIGVGLFSVVSPYEVYLLKNSKNVIWAAEKGDTETKKTATVHHFQTLI